MIADGFDFAQFSYIEQLRKLFIEHWYWCIRLVKSKFPYLWEYVKSQTPLLNDSYFTDRTRLMWVLSGRTEFPICRLCGREIRRNTVDGTYSETCGSCNIKIAALDEKRNQKLRDAQRLAKLADPDVYGKRADKCKATKMANHGDPNWNNREKSVNTFKRHCNDDPAFLQSIQARIKVKNNEKFGADWYVMTDEFEKKSAHTCIENWGVDRYSKSSGYKNACVITNNEKFGVDWYSQTDEYKTRVREKAGEILAKQVQTKRKHGTFNASKPEDNAYVELCRVFGTKNVFRNYNEDRRYPFACDFYIKSEDIFIECNFHWTHGGHWFDRNSEIDNAKLTGWKQKAGARHEASDKVNFYDIAIDVWTRRDILKRDTAASNRLNYAVFWKISDFREWLEEIFKNRSII